MHGSTPPAPAINVTAPTPHDDNDDEQQQGGALAAAGFRTDGAMEAAESDEEHFCMSPYTDVDEDGENDDEYMYWRDMPLPSVEEPFPGSEPDFREVRASSRTSSSLPPPPRPPSVPNMGASQQQITRESDDDPCQVPGRTPAVAVTVGSSGPLLEGLREAALESARRAEAREAHAHAHALAAFASNNGRGGRLRAATGPPALP